MVDLPCVFPDADDLGPGWRFCPGVEAGIAVQRYTQLDLVTIELAIQSFDVSGNFSIRSTGLQICLPHIWRKGEIYN
jgi:hypothetical protein